MNPRPVIARTLGRSPLIAVVLYVILVGGFIATACIAISDILDHMRALDQTSDLLERLQDRRGRGTAGASSPAAEHPGTPFLEGPTVTVAGATLLQHVASAVNAVGGTIQSSQLDVATQAKDGFVGLLVSCEMEQPALQKVLYDLEVGMPFLFVDQLDVQAPQTAPASENGEGRIRVVLGISGQWRGGK
ncbi:type II secretion system protein GspM [Bradyrhizobium sp.]|uniref:type II secretion system protein GspM n=1 Tax=Bradyrhizobium sp. TaxID=376 RepID=UPI003C71E18D